MRFRWPKDTAFCRVVLDVDQDRCGHCGRLLHVCDHRIRRIYSLQGPLELCCRLAHCSDPACPSRPHTLSPTAELSLALPGWLIGWDVFCFIGHRRFCRHWSVPQIQDELADTYRIHLSDDALSAYIRRYQAMVAARQQDPAQLQLAYRGIASVVLSIDGLQPEKGHETLYAVRELKAKRVWFAQALLSSTTAEVRRLLARARAFAQGLGKPVRLWISDKQDGFVKGIAAEFPGIPHRYCQNHFLRDLAKPMLEADSHAKVRMRKRVRGLRDIERGLLGQRVESAAAADPASQVVLDYCCAVRGILNDDQGGPLHPPGLRMAQALAEVRASLSRNLALNKPGQAHRHLERLAGCIDRGLAEAESQQEEVGLQLKEIREVAATLDGQAGTLRERRKKYQRLQRQYQNEGGAVCGRLARVLASWGEGLFVGVRGKGGKDLPVDNLDLERWFRAPKGHERRIHGHRHAGVRIVHEGPTLLLALDAHETHQQPFTAQDLLPYRDARDPLDQQEAIQRRKVMRKARSPKNGSRSSRS